MDVPFPRAASRRLISFLTFQISMFFSASLGCCSLPDMTAVVACGCVVCVCDCGSGGDQEILWSGGGAVTG